MGDSTNSMTNLERNESAKEAPESSNLLGDTMVCKSSNDLLKNQSTNSDNCFLPDAKMLLAQLSEPEVCKAPHHETRGTCDVTVDENGETLAVKNNKTGETFTKNADGTWDHRWDPNKPMSPDEKVTNVTVDSEGTLSYDYSRDKDDVHVHHEHHADGSTSWTDNFGKWSMDSEFRLTEMPAGEGRNRKFHYDENGKVDQIDGVLGHWDRQTVDGKTSWKNKDTGAVWEGDFTVDSIGRILEFRGRNGAAWDFTGWGTDIERPKFTLNHDEYWSIEIDEPENAKK